MTDQERLESEARILDMLTRAALAQKDHEKRVQDLELAPRLAWSTTMTAAAALMTAIAAVGGGLGALLVTLALKH
jgi:hypothetical protein